jgi:hypothetical protein
MLYIKVLFQIGVGVVGLLALLLDYKWQDKRRTVFKKTRNVLIGLSILLVITSVVLTIFDEKQKTSEIATLSEQLNLIKQNGDRLNLQIVPFLKIATDRYPNLSSERALDSLREYIQKIENQTSILQKSETVRQVKEMELDEMKKTSPKIEALLSMDHKRNVSVGVLFHNKVPIKFNYTLQHSQGDKVLSKGTTYGLLLYPPKDNRPLFIANDLNFKDHIPSDSISELKVTISYESIYYSESLNPNLVGNSSSKSYVIDPRKNTLTAKK